MSGGDGLRTHGIRQFQEAVEFDEGIAERARHGCTASVVFGYERLDHILLELPFQVDHVERKAHLFGNAAGIIDVVERAAATSRLLGGQFRETPLVP